MIAATRAGTRSKSSIHSDIGTYSAEAPRRRRGSSDGPPPSASPPPARFAAGFFRFSPPREPRASASSSPGRRRRSPSLPSRPPLSSTSAGVGLGSRAPHRPLGSRPRDPTEGRGYAVRSDVRCRARPRSRSAVRFACRPSCDPGRRACRDVSASSSVARRPRLGLLVTHLDGSSIIDVDLAGASVVSSAPEAPSCSETTSLGFSASASNVIGAATLASPSASVANAIPSSARPIVAVTFLPTSFDAPATTTS